MSRFPGPPPFASLGVDSVFEQLQTFCDAFVGPGPWIAMKTPPQICTALFYVPNLCSDPISVGTDQVWRFEPVFQRAPPPIHPPPKHTGSKPPPPPITPLQSTPDQSPPPPQSPPSKAHQIKAPPPPQSPPSKAHQIKAPPPQSPPSKAHQIKAPPPQSPPSKAHRIKAPPPPITPVQSTPGQSPPLPTERTAGLVCPTK